jgi:hypothetical protein
MKGLFWIGFGVLSLAWAANADELRDPTRPPTLPRHAAAPHETAREIAPTLSAVLNFNGERRAIFNGHLVRSGSSVGGYTIDAVLEDGVRYRHAGLSRELHMAHPVSSLKTPAVDVLRASSGVP